MTLFFSDITAILHHFDRFVVQQSYAPYEVISHLILTYLLTDCIQGFNFNYLFITSVCLLIVSHIVTAFYWGICLRNGTKVREREMPFNWSLFQVLQCKEEKSVAKKILRRYLPFVPACLPTLLFCRLAEIRVALEGGRMLPPEAWHALVQENLHLAWMANDVKIIGSN